MTPARDSFMSEALRMSEADPRPLLGGGGEQTALRRLRAMIVEDELLVAWHLESLLEELGHEICSIAMSADAAVTDFVGFEPDLVFMDVNLGPGPSGIETARRLLALREAPMIFVTAYGDAATRSAIAEAAPNSLVLSKPVTSLDLGRGIEVVMGTRH